MVQAFTAQSLRTPLSQAVESCNVCWTCRGLITDSSELSMKKHSYFCSQRKTLEKNEAIKHFVCDKSDYSIFISVKRCLDKLAEDKKLFSKLQSVFPQHFVKHLVDLTFSAFPNASNNLERSDSSSNKPCYYVVTNKECQTNLEETASRSNCSNLQVKSRDIHSDQAENSDKEFEKQRYGTAPENVVKSPIPSVEEITVSKSKLDSEEELILSRDSYKKEKNEKVIFVCRLCTHQTSSGKQMLRHQKSHNDGHPFECDPCKFSTLWRKEWKIHLQQKHKCDKFLCHICASEFQTNTALEQHIVSSHPEINNRGPKNRLQCQLCEYVAREMASLKEHMRKHTGEKIRCPHEGCKFASSYARSLNKHLRQKHSAEKTQCCYICGFQTRHASSLTKHISLIHKDFKPYKCAQCSFTALYPSEIISHARSKHLKVKRFACPKCPFKTSYQLAIQKHVARHNEPDGYTCLVCGEVLSSKNKAKKHMEKEHSSTHFQVVEEASWEKVNANDYKIKDCEDTSVDLNRIVVLNDGKSKNSSKKKGVKCKKVEDPKCLKTTNVFELDEIVIEAPIETIIEEVADVKAGKQCVGASSSFELPETLMQDAHNHLNTSNVSEPLSQDTSVYSAGRSTTAEGNPMLSGTTADFDDNENSLSSLFDLMSDFPRPTMLNRCQSASTLMFASLSPHLIDRPLTPDFFTDSPSVASFFPNFSTKNLEAEGLSLGTDAAYENVTVQQTLSAPSTANLSSQQAHFRNLNPSSPLTPSFLYSPQPGSGRSLGRVHLSPSIEQEPSCMEVDSVFAHLHSCPSDTPSNSAFVDLGQNFSTEIQAAVASIPMPVRTTSILEDADGILQESPFPIGSNV
ncbi:hypothetical protein EGW08_001755 [Elysia chlorotica]|uniref:C2H2-type domain-containing protein n=1 Tax=Elysia chlorotica TaxID=188477 RepID=A0A433U9J4_ELYCH|nr:hypothetical protein EGW08_001755 [Elysia chlorotica]